MPIITPSQFLMQHKRPLDLAWLRTGGPSMANCLRVPPLGPQSKGGPQVKVVKG